MTRRPFNNTIERMEWQVSNLVLFTIQPMAILVYVPFQIGITYIAVFVFLGQTVTGFCLSVQLLF